MKWIIQGKYHLTLNAPIATKFVCFSRLLKCLRSLYASIFNLPVMLGNYLQQTASADNIFRCIFFLGALRVISYNSYEADTKIKPNPMTFNCNLDRLSDQLVTLLFTVKPVLSGHSKRRPKLVFKTDYRLMQVKSIAECSKGSILQYF